MRSEALRRIYLHFYLPLASRGVEAGFTAPEFQGSPQRYAREGNQAREARIPIPSIRKSVLVPRSPDLAFRRFTTEVASWWPLGTKPSGLSRTGAIVFEEEVGGRILHREKGGRLRLWGTVEVWEPPRRVRFSFHPERAPAEAQTVEVIFEPHESGTRVTLHHSGWEALGEGGAALREEYDSGWEPVLGGFARWR